MIGTIFKLILLGAIGFCSLPFIKMNLMQEKEQCEKDVLKRFFQLKGRSIKFNFFRKGKIKRGQIRFEKSLTCTVHQHTHYYFHST